MIYNRYTPGKACMQSIRVTAHCTGMEAKHACSITLSVGYAIRFGAFAPPRNAASLKRTHAMAS